MSIDWCDPGRVPKASRCGLRRCCRTIRWLRRPGCQRLPVYAAATLKRNESLKRSGTRDNNADRSAGFGRADWCRGVGVGLTAVAFGSGAFNWGSGGNALCSLSGFMASDNVRLGRGFPGVFSPESATSGSASPGGVAIVSGLVDLRPPAGGVRLKPLLICSIDAGGGSSLSLSLLLAN